MDEPLPRLYTELAPWFPLLTAPSDYDEEAEVYRQILMEAADIPPRTLLELGCGGGNIASYFKQHFACTLTDVSAEMLAISAQLNPECEHVQGDMRSVRLGREFDAVFVHDAVVYMITEDDLRQAMTTAYVHCRPSGVAVFAPDFVRERFSPRTMHGGHDGDGRGLRYLEWDRDADPAGTSYVTEYAYLLREEGRPTRCEYDTHLCGLFGRGDWLRLLDEVGFRASVRVVDFEEEPAEMVEVFVAIRPAV
jgi:SAM-dependent methyltransferase